MEAPGQDVPAARATALKGLLVRRSVWLPSWRGTLLLVVCAGLLALGAGRGLYGFLAPHDPIRGEVMVVEGWLPKFACDLAAEEFRAHGYRRVVTTGGPLAPGSFVAYLFPDEGTHAHVGARALREAGLDADLVEIAPCEDVPRERTYAAARGLRDWLRRQDPPVRSVDLYCLGAHSRRSRLLYQLAVGEEVEVGIIAVEPLHYEAERWWASSAGIRAVMSEALGFCYAKFLFSPDR